MAFFFFAVDYDGNKPFWYYPQLYKVELAARLVIRRVLGSILAEVWNFSYIINKILPQQ